MQRLQLLGLATMAIITAACGNATAPAGSPRSTPTAAGSPGSTAGTEPAASPTSTACRLPLWSAPGGTPRGGFITLPGGTFAPDPDSAMALNPSGVWSTSRTPALHGSAGTGSYSWKGGRWVPAPLDAVSPDGLRYAWVETASDRTVNVHVVNVTSGDDAVISHQPLDLPEWRGDGIYMVEHVVGQDASRGLWRLDPTSGAATRVAAGTGQNGRNADWRMGITAAWRNGFDGAAPETHTLDQDPFAANEVVRLEVAGGARETWFHRPNQSVEFVGVDHLRRPWISVGPAARDSAATLYAATDADRGDVLMTLAGANDSVLPLADGGRTWTWSRMRGLGVYADGHHRQIATSGISGDASLAGVCA